MVLVVLLWLDVGVWDEYVMDEFELGLFVIFFFFVVECLVICGGGWGFVGRDWLG